MAKVFQTAVYGTLLQCMTILLEYYNENHMYKFNNLLTVLLKYINLFSMTVNILKNLELIL